MKIHYIIQAIEELAPRYLQESWDNSGLQVGLPPEADGECTGVLICLDVTPEIIREAVDKGCNLVLSHHPLIFKGLKSLAGNTLTEQAVAEAVRSGVAVYSAHTSLDSATGGISHEMALMLGVFPRRVLVPGKDKLMKVTTFAPRESAEQIRLMLLDEPSPLPVLSCSVTETLLEEETPEKEALATSILKHVPMVSVSTVTPEFRWMELAKRIAGNVENSMVYGEELRDPAIPYGLGVLGPLDAPMPLDLFIGKVREVFRCKEIRASLGAADPHKAVRMVALCGGSGGEFIDFARRQGADVYITADVRYHDFADHRQGMAVLDIGHYESENCAKSIFYERLCGKFRNFAVYKSQLENNPVIYL